MVARVLTWSGPEGGNIAISFDEKNFGVEEMRTEIDFMVKAHPSLPDEVPSGTNFLFAKEGTTGHLVARFKVGDTVFRNVAQRSLHRLWDTVHLIDQLSHPERHKSVS